MTNKEIEDYYIPDDDFETPLPAASIPNSHAINGGMQTIWLGVDKGYINLKFVRGIDPAFIIPGAQFEVLATEEGLEMYIDQLKEMLDNYKKTKDEAK